MTSDESPSSLWLVCPKCGQIILLPDDGTIKPRGMLALPEHPASDNTEDLCPVSGQLVMIYPLYSSDL